MLHLPLDKTNITSWVLSINNLMYISICNVRALMYTHNNTKKKICTTQNLAQQDHSKSHTHTHHMPSLYPHHCQTHGTLGLKPPIGWVWCMYTHTHISLTHTHTHTDTTSLSPHHHQTPGFLSPKPLICWVWCTHIHNTHTYTLTHNTHNTHPSHTHTHTTPQAYLHIIIRPLGSWAQTPPLAGPGGAWLPAWDASSWGGSAGGSTGWWGRAPPAPCSGRPAWTGRWGGPTRCCRHCCSAACLGSLACPGCRWWAGWGGCRACWPAAGPGGPGRWTSAFEAGTGCWRGRGDNPCLVTGGDNPGDSKSPPTQNNRSWLTNWNGKSLQVQNFRQHIFTD